MKTICRPWKQVRAILAGISVAASAERDRWILWAPIAFGSGIAGYFALDREPDAWIGPLFLTTALSFAYIMRRVEFIFLVVIAIALFWSGFGIAKFRSDTVSAPVLQKSVIGTLSGRVVRIEAFPGRPRVLLDQLHLSGTVIKPHALPERVLLRLSQPIEFEIGNRVTGRARLLPLPGPVSPGAFDYQRKSWFERIGATGFALGHFERQSGPTSPGLLTGLPLRIDSLRKDLGDYLERAVRAPENALVIALITGDRSRIPRATTQALRDSGLAHLLAISGLHIGLVAGFVFGAVRAVIAAIEHLALRVDAKRWAAAAALVAAFLYLLISGATLPTQRAFVMSAMVLGAIFFGREAISLRMVALAAMAVLLVQPESLLSASFQMSFAAVTALVAFYEWARPHFRHISPPRVNLRRKILLYFVTLVATTVVAGLATGLVAYHHFGRIAHYGLFANILAVPITALWIMPMAVLSVVLMPFGLEILPLAAMSHGISIVTGIATEVASWPGAVTHHPQFPIGSFCLAISGGLFLCLIRSRARFFGVIIMGAAFATAPFVQRPDILIDQKGHLVAVRLADGMLGFSSTTRNRFATEKWLQNEGQSHAIPWIGSDTSDRDVNCDAVGCIYRNDGHRVAFIDHPAAAMEDCGYAQLVVFTNRRSQRCSLTESPTINLKDLRPNGAYAVYLQRDGPRLVATNDVRGSRPWTWPQYRRRSPTNRP